MPSYCRPQTLNKADGHKTHQRWDSSEGLMRGLPPAFYYEHELIRVNLQESPAEHQRRMGLSKTNFASIRLEPNVMSLSLAFHKKSRSLCASRDAKFLKNIRQVVLDRFVAEPEGNGDFLVGLAFGNQGHDAFLLR